MATLAFTQNLVDKLHAQPPKEMAQQSPQTATPAPTTPAPEPQPTAPTPQASAPSDEGLISEANSIKDLDHTLSSGFEAVSKLADAMKEVTGVKKSIAKRIKERLQNGEQTT